MELETAADFVRSCGFQWLAAQFVHFLQEKIFPTAGLAGCQRLGRGLGDQGGQVLQIRESMIAMDSASWEIGAHGRMAAVIPSPPRCACFTWKIMENEWNVDLVDQKLVETELDPDGKQKWPWATEVQLKRWCLDRYLPSWICDSGDN